MRDVRRIGGRVAVGLRACTNAVRAVNARQLGQDVAEYGLLLATIAIAILIAMTAFGNEIGPLFQRLAGYITTTGT